MNIVRIGVIGVGNMGSNHCRQIAEGNIPEMELAAVADISQSRRDWAKENLPENIIIYESAESLLDLGEVDAVLIATPHYLHPEIAIKAMKKGIHVLSEKPAGVYTKQVREMNEEADRHNLVFGLMFNQRTNPVYRKLRELVQGGEYGAIKRVNWIITDWYRTQAYYDSGDWRATWDGEGGGVLLNQCPHNLDLLQWICGMPVKVQAFCHEGKWHHIEVEDDVTAYLEYANGATGVFITSTGDAPGTNRLEIDLERAKLVSENGKLMMYEMKTNEREFCFTSTAGFAQPQGEWVTVETTGENTQHNGVLAAFASAILRNTPLIAKGQEGINGLTLSNAMHLSGWLHQIVTIPFDEDLFLCELNKRREKSQKKHVEADVTFDTTGSYGA
ncbi:MAG TPA: Gfo/Idh/MocA family oxidoreductase [Lachnospiraceae bacterium]|nr:Gfo/Idh/MocA family oxidoreductase [Lachnospiraceae bacterium]